jgi:hypothetical protein
MDSIFLVREFDREKDFPMIEEWHRDRCMQAPPFSILPKFGVVAFRASTRKDVAALWLYMDNSVGVCFAEHIATAPGLTLREFRGAVGTALEFLKMRAADMNYGLMMIHTLPPIARLAKAYGFIEAGKNRVTMVAPTRKVSDGSN